MIRGKRGQFYLVTIVIILGMIVSFSIIANYAKKKASIRLYDVSKELSIESANVLDYGTYNELDDAEMQALLESFVNEYVEYAGEGRNLYFIFGDTTTISAIAYQDLAAEDVYVNTGCAGCANQLLVVGEIKDFTVTNPEKKVTITIGEDSYTFTLKTGENFYFVIYEEIEGETHVVTG